MKHVLRRLRSNMWKRIIKIYKSNNKCASICGIKFCKIQPLLLTLTHDNLSYPQGEFLAVHIVAQIHQTRKLEYLCISSILYSFIHLWRVFFFFGSNILQNHNTRLLLSIILPLPRHLFTETNWFKTSAKLM